MLENKNIGLIEPWVYFQYWRKEVGGPERNSTPKKVPGIVPKKFCQGVTTRLKIEEILEHENDPFCRINTGFSFLTPKIDQ